MFLTVGCGRNDDTGHISEETRRRLRTLDDSIDAMSPKSLSMIAGGMASAVDSLTWYGYYLRYARYYYLSQTPDSMLPYIDRTLDFADGRKPGPAVNGIKAFALELKADYSHMYRKNHDEVIGLHTEAYDLMMRSDNKGSLPEICANLADAYAQISDMAQAAAWYRRALFLVDSLKMPDTKNITLYLGLANIYMQLKDYDSSLRYYQETSRYYDLMAPNMQAYYLNNFGNYYYFRKDYGEALKVFLRLERMLDKYGNDGMAMATCRVNLADVYLNLGDDLKAEEYVAQAERFFAGHSVYAGMYYANSIRIALAVKAGRPHEVEKIIASEKFAAPGDHALVGIRNKYIRLYHESTGGWKAALRSLEDEMRVSDSIEEARSHMRASEIMQRLKEDTLLLHHAIEMNAKDIELRNMWGVVAAIVVLTLVVAMLWGTYTYKRKLRTEMDMMYLRLANVRNRISPHFMFNVLNNHMHTMRAEERERLMMLVKLLRADLDMSRNMFISLADEINFVKYYVDIEKPILGDDFEFTVEVPDDGTLSEISVPSMFVQILVENSIKHGLKGKDGTKRLSIKVDALPGCTVVTVADNGNGFDMSRVRSDRTRTGLDIIRHTIRIINERRKRNFMRFDISNLTDGDGNTAGCEARLTIPADVRP
jgi:tetratricopeptide (TPR) repeat protein